MQTAPPGMFNGSMDCLMQTVRKEGLKAVYKGVTPPLLGWMVMDTALVSLYALGWIDIDVLPSLLGSLNVYKGIIARNFYHTNDRMQMHWFGHGIAGAMSGVTVSFLAAPVEHIKARRQVMYDDTRKVMGMFLFFNCISVTITNPSVSVVKNPGAAVTSIPPTPTPRQIATRIFNENGFFALWHGLRATIAFRAFFFVWWGSQHELRGYMESRTSLSTNALNFWSGALSAQLFWVFAHPFDVVKQNIMIDPLIPGTSKGEKYGSSWTKAVRGIYAEAGPRGFVKGFWPSMLRAAPTNGVAFAIFEMSKALMDRQSGEGEKGRL